MRSNFIGVTKGDLVYFKYGLFANSSGIVIDIDYRREHSYLDNELWLFILFNNSINWHKAEDITLEVISTVA
jgi:hypothetical protein